MIDTEVETVISFNDARSAFPGIDRVIARHPSQMAAERCTWGPSRNGADWRHEIHVP